MLVVDFQKIIICSGHDYRQIHIIDLHLYIFYLAYNIIQIQLL